LNECINERINELTVINTVKKNNTHT